MQLDASQFKGAKTGRKEYNEQQYASGDAIRKGKKAETKKSTTNNVPNYADASSHPE